MKSRPATSGVSAEYLPGCRCQIRTFSGGLPELVGGLVRDVRLLLVVQELARAVVAVHGDEDAALRVLDPLPARVARETAEHLRVDHAQAGAGQHRDRQLGGHGQVQRDPVAALEAAEVPQQRGELVDPDVQLLVGDVLDGLGLQLGDEVDRGLVAVLGEVAVHAVVGGVELAADEPLPERRIGEVQRLVPRLVPGEHVGIFFEALREVLLAEAIQDVLVLHVRLGDELGRRIVVLLLLPVDRHLGFVDFGALSVRHLKVSLSADVGSPSKSGGGTWTSLPREGYWTK